jgi:hypothetical protein
MLVESNPPLEPSSFDRERETSRDLASPGSLSSRTATLC